MGDLGSNAASGVVVAGYRRGTATTDPWNQFVVPVKDEITSFRGRASCFQTLGNAAVQQVLQTHFNASGSTVTVRINRITVDLLTTVVKAATVVPPVVRMWKIAAAPTGGTALNKTPMDSRLTAGSNASVTALGATASDGGAATAITATLPAGTILAQKFAPRLITAAGYEMVDTIPFFYGEPDVILQAGQGLAVVLDAATVTTGNPNTDRWICELDWDEFTRP